jgi:hypothetical protein
LAPFVLKEKESEEVVETQSFICEIIKPIKRRNSKTALNKNKSMNKVLSVHTSVEQCLYRFLRDGQCYNGQVPYGCNEFERQAKEIDIEKMSSELENRLSSSVVLQYQRQAAKNKVNADSEEMFIKPIPFPPMDEERKRISEDGIVTYVWFDPKVNSTTKTKIIKYEGHETQLKVIATGGGRTNKNVPKSICTECGAMVQYPHDAKKVTVKCWLCVAKKVLAHKNKKPETQDMKTKGTKTNGKRTSIPKRKKTGRRNSRA